MIFIRRKVSKAVILSLLSFLFIFSSCTNVFESSVDNAEETKQERPAASDDQTPASTPDSAPAPIPKITFGGSFRVEGALPSTLQQVLANPEDTTIDPL